MSIKRDGGNNTIPSSVQSFISKINADHASDPEYKDKSICSFLVDKELKKWFAPVTLPCGRVVSLMTRELIHEHLANFFAINSASSLVEIFSDMRSKKGDLSNLYEDRFTDKRALATIQVAVHNLENNNIYRDDGVFSNGQKIPTTIEFLEDNKSVRFTVKANIDIYVYIYLPGAYPGGIEEKRNTITVKFEYKSPSYILNLNSNIFNGNQVTDQLWVDSIIPPDKYLLQALHFSDMQAYSSFLKLILTSQDIDSVMYLKEAIDTWQNDITKSLADGKEFMSGFNFKGMATLKLPIGNKEEDAFSQSYSPSSRTSILSLISDSENDFILDSRTVNHYIYLTGLLDIIGFGYATKPMFSTTTIPVFDTWLSSEYVGVGGNRSVYYNTEVFELKGSKTLDGETHDFDTAVIYPIANDLITLCKAVGYFDAPQEYKTMAALAASKNESNVRILTSPNQYSISFTGVGDSLAAGMSIITVPNDRAYMKDVSSSFTGVGDSVSGSTVIISAADDRTYRKDVSFDILTAVDNWLAPLKKRSILTEKYKTVKVSSKKYGSDIVTTIETLVTPESLIASFPECGGSKFDSKELNDAFKEANDIVSGKNITNNVNNIMAAAMSQAGIVGQFAGIPNEVFGGLTDADKVMTAISEKAKQNKLAQARNKVSSLQYHTTMRNPATKFSSRMQKLDVGASMNVDKRERNEYGAMGPLGLVEKVDSPASLRIYREDNTTAGSNGINQIYVDCFLLTDVQEVDEEKYSIFQSLNGDTLVQFFGRRPTTLNLSGILMDTKNQQWYNDFKYWYDNYLRGSAAIKNDSRIVLVYTDQIIEGFILSMNVQKNAATNMTVHVNFTMLVVSHTPLATEWTDPEHSEIDRGYNGGQANPDVGPDAESRFADFMETISGDLISDAALEDVAAKKDAAIDKEVKKTKLYGVLDYSSGSTIQAQAFNSRLFDPKLDISLSEVSPSLIASAKVQSSTGGNLSNAANSEDASGINMPEFKLTLNTENGARNYRNMQEKSILDQVSYRILS